MNFLRGRRWTKRVSVESILLAVIVGTTGWILLGSFSFDSDASRLFPRLSGGIVVSLVVLHLVWRYIPDQITAYLPTHEALTYGDDDTESDIYDEREVAVILSFFGVFVVMVYVLGFFLAAPIYLYSSLVYFDYGDRRRRLVALLAFVVIVMIAYEVLRIPPDQGMVPKLLL